MRVLIEIGKIPIGSKVTKRTGEKLYEVRDKISIYAEEGCAKPLNEINASPGTKLLVSTDPQYSFAILAVPDTLEVIWHAENYALEQMLYLRNSDNGK